MAAGSSKKTGEASVDQAGLPAREQDSQPVRDGAVSGDRDSSLDSDDLLLLARIAGGRGEVKGDGEGFFKAICARIERRQEQLQQQLAEREGQLEQLKKSGAESAREAEKAALRQCAERFLRVADALDEEIAAPAGDPDKGLKDVRAQLQEVFKSLGVEEFEPRPGDRHDPGEHAVWATGEATPRIKAGCIISSHQKGYRIKGGGLLREAGVTVARQQASRQERPAKPEAAMGAYEHARRARERAKAGDIDAALAGYDRALAIEANPCTYAQRAEARAQKGDLGGAIADFERASRFANLSDAERRDFRNRAGSLRRKQARQGAPAAGGGKRAA